MKKETVILIVILTCTMLLVIGTGCSEYAYHDTWYEPAGGDASFEPIRFTGTGELKTDTFNIPDREWTVDWSYSSTTPEIAVFNVYIYLDRWVPYFVASINPTTETYGSQEIRFGPGDYYIDIRPYDIESWELVIRPCDVTVKE